MIWSRKMEFEYIKSLCELSRKNGFRKELALVESGNSLLCILGTFGEDNRLLTGISLNRNDVISLFNWGNERQIEKVLSEEEKFLEDYLQQAHNGSVNEKEMTRW